jgi:hypothetical protein
MVTSNDGPLPAGLGGGGAEVCESAGTLSISAKDKTNTTCFMFFMDLLLESYLFSMLLCTGKGSIFFQFPDCFRTATSERINIPGKPRLGKKKRSLPVPKFLT